MENFQSNFGSGTVPRLTLQRHGSKQTAGVAGQIVLLSMTGILVTEITELKSHG